MELVLYGAALWVMCGIFAAYLASQKRRSGTAWFFIGLLCGPIGLIAVAGVPVVGVRPSAPATHVGGLEDLQTAMTRSQDGAGRV